jgi:hypothetical protein
MPEIANKVCNKGGSDMNQQQAIAMMVAMALCGCATTASAPPSVGEAGTNDLTKASQGVQLQLLHATADAEALNKEFSASAQNYDGDPNRGVVLQECGAKQGSEAFAILGVVVTAVFDYVINWATDAVQTEVKKYTKTYSAQKGDFFYQQVKAGDAVPESLRANVKCVRLVRMDPADKKLAALDFIAELKVSQSGDYFQIRPLSLYYSKPLAEGTPMSVAIELTGQETWFERTGGKTASVFDSTAVTSQFSAEDLKTPKTRYFLNASAPPGGDPFTPWDKLPQLPLPSVSVDSKGSLVSDPQGIGWVMLTAKVTEVGGQPGWLKDLASLLKSEGSNISKGLASAVDSQLGISQGSGSGKSGTN